MLFGDAIVSFARLRDMAWVGDAGVEIHLVVSLLKEAEGRLPRAVADARESARR